MNIIEPAPPIKCRITIDKDLESETAGLPPKDLRTMASKFRNLAHQLEFKALIMEIDAMPKPPKKLRRLPARKLRAN